MLSELLIENFAIIEHLDLQLETGLITFTGETGAGKSIIIDAVDTLLGGKVDTNLVRSGAERAVVEGAFRLLPPYRQAVHAVLQREDLLDDPDILMISREIRANGRSTARVNGHAASTSLLKELGELLIDVHGQSEHLSLLRVNQHLPLLDQFIAAQPNGEKPAFAEQLQSYQEIYKALVEARQALHLLRTNERENARRMDLLKFQVQEIQAARLRIGEEEELRAERNRLANAEGLASLVQQCLLALDEGAPETPAATDLMGEALHAIHSLVRLDASQSDLAEEAQEIFNRLQDLIHQLRIYQEGIEFNPRRLDQVEERLALISNLKRKYGDAIEAVLSFAEHARQELEEISHADERIQALEQQCFQLEKKLGELGERLSARRREGAHDLSRLIEKELADLQMSGARFQVSFNQAEEEDGILLSDGRRVGFNARGLDRVEFLIAPNPGEGFKPLAKTASGGETSRLMLALKNVLAQADPIPTLIFDEIDQGIGGRTGSVVGYKLWKLGRKHQVICITHLPQLAAYGDQHFHVKKSVEAGRTLTQVHQLEGEGRLVELAQMIGKVSDGTLHSAQEILQMAARHTAGN